MVGLGGHERVSRTYIIIAICLSNRFTRRAYDAI